MASMFMNILFVREDNMVKSIFELFINMEEHNLITIGYHITECRPLNSFLEAIRRINTPTRNALSSILINMINPKYLYLLLNQSSTPITLSTNESKWFVTVEE